MSVGKVVVEPPSRCHGHHQDDSSIFLMEEPPTWRNLHRFAMLHILKWVQLTSPLKTCHSFVLLVFYCQILQLEISLLDISNRFSQQKCTQKPKASMTLLLRIEVVKTPSLVVLQYDPQNCMERMRESKLSLPYRLGPGSWSLFTWGVSWGLL